MALQTYVSFDTAQETTDGRGWKLTYWDDATPLTQTVEWYWRLRNKATLRSTITNKALTTNVVTLTTAAAHGYVTGQTVQVLIGDASFDGTYVLASASGTTFTYAKTAGNVTSAAATGYAVVAQIANHAATVTNKALTSNVVTLTFSGPHAMVVGEWVTVVIGDSSFDGTYQLSAVASTTISYAKVASNVSSAAATGTATTAKSLDGRLREIYAADNSINGVVAYFAARAQADLIAANGATLTTTSTTYLAGEGLDTP